MNKYFGNKGSQGYSVCDLNQPITESNIPVGALKQHNRIIYRQKFNADGSSNKFSARCYTDRSHQPESTYYSTYAGTCATSDKFIMFAGYNAMAAQRNLHLDLFTFDIPGAFLQSRLTNENTPQECYIHFASDIRHQCAGKWYRRLAGTYGSKDANHLFDIELANTFAKAQFIQTSNSLKSSLAFILPIPFFPAVSLHMLMTVVAAVPIVLTKTNCVEFLKTALVPSLGMM
jgi:hypothetical protein